MVAAPMLRIMSVETVSLDAVMLTMHLPDADEDISHLKPILGQVMMI